MTPPKVPGIVPGEFLRDLDDPRILAALPRDKGEAEAAYAGRLAAHELAVIRQDAELRNAAAYTAAKAEAIRWGIPLIVLGGPPRPKVRESGSAPFDLAAYRKERAEKDAALPPAARR
jgi:hypothetical protein